MLLPNKENCQCDNEKSIEIKILTNAGVKGAVMDPILPIIEEKANRLCLYLVGYNSAVYT